jgi:hypothetical protein
MKGIFGKVVDFASGLRQATTAAHELIAERRRAIAATRAELQRAEAGPRPPAEVIGRFEAWVDELAAYQAREYGAGLVVHRFGSVSKDPGTGAPWGPGTAVEWGFLCLFAGDLVKRAFADLVRATPYEAGPPAAARPALVERLRGELAQLEAEEEQLVDEAAAAGVAIAHRPEVTDRRYREQRQREREERAAADRAAREAMVNARHERATVAESQYLARNRPGQLS